MTAIVLSSQHALELSIIYKLIKKDLIVEALSMDDPPALEITSFAKTRNEALTEYFDCYNNGSPKEIAAQRKVIELSVTQQNLTEAFNIFSQHTDDTSKLGCILVIRKVAEMLQADHCFYV